VSFLQSCCGGAAVSHQFHSKLHFPVLLWADGKLVWSSISWRRGRARAPPDMGVCASSPADPPANAPPQPSSTAVPVASPAAPPAAALTAVAPPIGELPAAVIPAAVLSQPNSMAAPAVLQQRGVPPWAERAGAEAALSSITLNDADGKATAAGNAANAAVRSNLLEVCQCYRWHIAA
jgi:hypothetical protein